MAQLFSNNAAGKLQSSIGSGDGSFTLQTGQGVLFPSPSGGDFFLVTLFEAGETNHEIVKCTSRSGDVLTVTRAQESTTARAYAAGTSVELRVTAATMKQAVNYTALIAQEADGTATGGNARGTYAADLQIYRAINTQVASGTSSFAAGEGNTASGSYGVAIGRENQAIGTGSVAIGYANIAYGYGGFTAGYVCAASGSGSVALGYNTIAGNAYSVATGKTSSTRSIVGARAHSSGYVTDSQIIDVNLAASTTDATATRLLSNTGISSTSQLRIQNYGAMAFDGTVVARQQGADGTQSAAWKVEGLILRDANAASTTLVASTVTAISNAPGWALSLSADTTNGTLAVTGTGAAATDIRWSSYIRASEVVYS